MSNLFTRIVVTGLLLSLSRLASAQQPSIHALTPGDIVPTVQLEKLAILTSGGFNSPDSPQLMLLHFWNSGCMESLKAIPSLDLLQKQFGGRIRLILISPENDEKVRQLFAKINYVPTSVSVITKDSLWNTLFPNLTVPQHVWLKSTGEVLYVTEAFNATQKNLTEVLAGKRPRLLEKLDDSTYSIEKPLWSKFQMTRWPSTLYNSTVTGRMAGVSSGILKIWDTAAGITGIRVVNQSLLSLFRTAFTNYGSDFESDNRIILNIPDSEVFKIPLDKNLWNDWLSQHVYCYELTLPLKKRSDFFEVMRQDLGRYFGYKGVVETRLTECLVLRNVRISYQLRTQGGKSSKERLEGVLRIRNLPIQTSLYSAIKHANQNFPLPILNETKEQRIDLDLKANLTDIPSLRNELQKLGLDLIVAKRRLSMLVIRPSKM